MNYIDDGTWRFGITHRWWDCCTDGFLMGPFSSAGLCYRLQVPRIRKESTRCTTSGEEGREACDPSQDDHLYQFFFDKATGLRYMDTNYNGDNGNILNDDYRNNAGGIDGIQLMSKQSNVVGDPDSNTVTRIYINMTYAKDVRICAYTCPLFCQQLKTENDCLRDRNRGSGCGWCNDIDPDDSTKFGYCFSYEAFGASIDSAADQDDSKKFIEGQGAKTCSVAVQTYSEYVDHLNGVDNAVYTNVLEYFGDDPYNSSDPTLVSEPPEVHDGALQNRVWNPSTSIVGCNQTGFYYNFDNLVCDPCDDIPTGCIDYQECTATSNTVCNACDENHYYDSPEKKCVACGSIPATEKCCKETGECSDDQPVSVTCTSESSFQCSHCIDWAFQGSQCKGLSCGLNQYIEVGTGCRQCTPTTRCDVVLSECGTNNDAICGACQQGWTGIQCNEPIVCESNQYYDGQSCLACDIVGLVENCAEYHECRPVVGGNSDCKTCSTYVDTDTGRTMGRKVVNKQCSECEPLEHGNSCGVLCDSNQYYNYGTSQCELCADYVEHCTAGYAGCGGTDTNTYCLSCNAGYRRQGSQCVAEELVCNTNGRDQLGNNCGTCEGGLWSNNQTCCACCSFNEEAECCLDGSNPCCSQAFDNSICDDPAPESPNPPGGVQVVEVCSIVTLTFINGSTCCPDAFSEAQCARGNLTYTPERDNSIGVSAVSWNASSDFVPAFAVGLAIAIAFTVLVAVGAIIATVVAHKRSKNKDDMQWGTFFSRG